MKRETISERSYNTNTSLKPPSKKQAAYFLAGSLVLTMILQLYIIHELKAVTASAIIPLMWIPALVAVACSKYFGNKYRDLALIQPGELSMVYAYVIPAVSVIISLVVLLLIGIGEFKMPQTGWLRLLLFQPTLGVAVNLFLALGEEIGWRGYLHTHFMRARIREPMIVTGLLWSIWYWPLIFMTDYSSSSVPLFSVFLFTICMTSFSVILGWLREFSKSVIPCAIAHATHMTWLQNIMPEFYQAGQFDAFFRGESGFVLAIVYLLIAMYLYRFHIAESNY